jgi:hypothetical protein
VLRWQVLFNKALKPFLVSAYAVVAGVIGMACGYFAESLAAHIRPSSEKTAFVQERKASRVEVWLKAQTVVFEKPAAAQVEPDPPVAVLPDAAFQQPVRHAAEMAAALDGSEAISIPLTESIVAAEEGSKSADSVTPVESLVVADIRELAESTAVSLAPAESLKSADSLNPVEPIVAVENSSSKRVIKLQAAKRRTSVPASAAAKVKIPAGDKSKLAATKLRKMPKPVALAKTITPAGLGSPVIRARFADTPSEIIRRSLMGTG